MAYKRTFPQSSSSEIDTQINGDKQLHERNVYRQKPPNFAKLAERYPEFGKYVNVNQGIGKIDFKDPEAVRQLAYTLLKDDFDLEVDFPLDRLCPMIPNRLNYLLWIEDLLKATKIDQEDIIKGIDIGIGASCIYPLLGCRLNSTWNFLGTEIDSRSFSYAKANVIRNELSDRIQLYLNPTTKTLPLNEIDENSRYSFTMCNPPFYESYEQVEAGINTKKLKPHAVCTGSSNELITQGGEAQFISAMISESLELLDRVSWYTTMVGRKETLDIVVTKLKSSKINNYAVTEFCQGVTRRWGLAWSFLDQRLYKEISQPASKRLKKLAPPTTQFTQTYSISPVVCYNLLRDLMEELRIEHTIHENPKTLNGTARINTWSRSARRLLQRGEFNLTCLSTESILFEFESQIEAGDIPDSTNVKFTWIKGEKRDLFESFYSHVKKRIENHVKALSSEHI
ncbi:hypothetical protein K7432_007565 [Basidiobolus ranarum]|uniref:U6 small nuclear RNA (adenine-(43)-N(6))-methyltransferase n=1 Tax=Basidiobolus ranarum TaxID=34480 RepID=A0ABR2VZW3_9FUNG